MNVSYDFGGGRLCQNSIPGNPPSKRRDWTAFHEEGPHRSRSTFSTITAFLPTTLQKLLPLPIPPPQPCRKLPFYLPCGLSLGKETFLLPDLKFQPTKLYSEPHKSQNFPSQRLPTFKTVIYPTVIEAPEIRRGFVYVFPYYKNCDLSG